MSFVSYQPDNIVFENHEQPLKDLTAKDVTDVQNGTVFIGDEFCEIGVYDEKGWLCPESILLRHTTNMPKTIHKNVDHVKFINEPVLYLGVGYLLAHFGHFLAEGIARAWALLYSKYKNAKIVIPYETNQKMPYLVRRTLNVLGVPDENIIIIYKTTKFAHVYVPKQAMNWGICAAPIMNKVFDKISKSLTDKKYKTYDKIYLSRSAMKQGHIFGEEQIEKIFQKNGYKIIHPETLPLEQQITLANGCKEMAGTAGSALHLALFMKPGGRVIQIKRNSDNDDNIDFQKLMCDLRKLDLVWVYGSIETIKTPHYTKIPQAIGITPYLLKFFDDNNIKYSEHDIAFDAKEFKRYKRQLYKYKAHKVYKKFVDIPVRFISLCGITKHGRKIIREYLYSKFHA